MWCAKPDTALEFGRGASPVAALAALAGIVEGAATAGIACQLALRHGVEVPIADAVCRIIDENAAADQVITELLARPAFTEFTKESI